MLDQLAEYTIPVLHPIVVHFPIALGVVALVTAALWLVRNQHTWWASTLVLEALAFVGAFVALRTGEQMEEQSEGVAMVDRFVDLHESMGERALWALGIALAGLVAARWYGRRDTEHAGTPMLWRILAFLLVLAAAVLVGITGHIGGLMTWGVPA